MKNNSISYITKVGVLSALALIIYMFEFPILVAFPWLMVDFSEVPVLLGGFAMGPFAGILIEGIKNVLHFAIKGSTGGVGELANFSIGLAFAIPVLIMYVHKKSRKTAILGMLIGIVFACGMSVILNLYVFIPLYFPELENVWAYIFMGAVPVTAIKCLINGVAVFIIYPFLSSVLHQ